MSRIIGKSEDEITDNPEETALTAAATLNSTVVLKGPSTFIASPEGELFCYDAGDVGLATSGSGDTLAGVVAGLIARGATPLHSAIWAVFLHGSAGNRLAKRVGRIGYLARELLDEIPPVMNGL
jgi:NAD(P)H-hydrate repair Nnr-like enzyme with NAD(P)H-hydrate dehydratase domain